MRNIFLRLVVVTLSLFGFAEAVMYTASGKFIVGSEVGSTSDGSLPSATYSNGDTRISWGGGDQQSYLQLVEKSGDADGNGTAYPFGDLIHGNFPISPPSLKYVDLEWTLDVPTTPSGQSFNRTWNFRLYNWETNNALDDNGECPRETDGVVVSPPPNAHPFLGDGTSASVCDDAHNFGAIETGSFEEDYTWVDDNNTIWVFQFSGFYNQADELTSTFWSPENGESTGSVKFSVKALGPNDAVIGDRVWADTNNNGTQDPEETTGPIGFTVELWEVNTTSGVTIGKVDETVTGANGEYVFANVKKNR